MRSLVRTLVLGCLLAGTATAAEAPLPAILSAKAAHSQLLDVARAGTRLVAVGERGHIVVSDDEGASWRQVAAPTRALLTAVWFSGDRNGWAVGHDSTILRTADGGLSWTLQSHALFDQAAVDAELDAQLDSGSDQADVEGESRVASKAQRIGAPLMDVWFDAAGRHGFVVGAYGLLQESHDGGISWHDRSDSLGNADGWHINAIAATPRNPDALILVGEKGAAFRSTDGGNTFSRFAAPMESSLFGAIPVADATYAFGLQGRLYRIAGSWQPVASGVTFGLNDAAEMADHSIVVVGNAGIVVTVSPQGKAKVVRRTDRQAVLSVVPVKDGLVLVGEGGAKRARPDGSAP